MSKFYTYRCEQCGAPSSHHWWNTTCKKCGGIIQQIEQDETEITQSRAYKIMQRQGQSIAKMLESYVKAFSAEAVHHGITLFNDYVLKEYITREDVPEAVIEKICEGDDDPCPENFHNEGND